MTYREPRYPGDTIRTHMLVRGDELGDIRVQWVGGKREMKVCAFIPGNTECTPGDTPKTWPDLYRYCETQELADTYFQQFVQNAYAQGWVDYDRNRGL